MPATVTGRLTDARGTILASTAFQVRLLLSGDLTALHLAKLTAHTTDGSGNFSIPGLYRGSYQFEFNTDRVKFTVPDSSGTFALTDILNRAGLTPTTFDAETSSWISRAEIAGGVVSINTRFAIQQFVASLKSASLWTKLQEIGVFAGSNLSSALVKLKYVTAPNLVNSNFVAADYTETTGLAGDGTSKRLDTGYNLLSNLPDFSHMSFYTREATTGGSNRTMIGGLGPSATDQYTIISLSGNNDSTGRLGQQIQVQVAGSAIAAHYMVSRQSLTDLRLYRNGVQLGSTTVTATTLVKPNINPFLWAYNANGSAGGWMIARGCYYSIGSALTPAEALNYYSIVQTLQTALGRQV